MKDKVSNPLNYFPNWKYFKQTGSETKIVLVGFLDKAEYWAMQPDMTHGTAGHPKFYFTGEAIENELHVKRQRADNAVDYLVGLGILNKKLQTGQNKGLPRQTKYYWFDYDKMQSEPIVDELWPMVGDSAHDERCTEIRTQFAAYADYMADLICEASKPIAGDTQTPEPDHPEEEATNIDSDEEKERIERAIKRGLRFVSFYENKNENRKGFKLSKYRASDPSNVFFDVDNIVPIVHGVVSKCGMYSAQCVVCVIIYEHFALGKYPVKQRNANGLSHLESLLVQQLQQITPAMASNYENLYDQYYYASGTKRYEDEAKEERIKAEQRRKEEEERRMRYDRDYAEKKKQEELDKIFAQKREEQARKAAEQAKQAAQNPATIVAAVVRPAIVPRPDQKPNE